MLTNIVLCKEINSSLSYVSFTFFAHFKHFSVTVHYQCQLVKNDEAQYFLQMMSFILRHNM